jgi:type IV pilus assembly protein PilY1
MKTSLKRRMIAAMFAGYAAAIAFPGPARAELADLADVPLANSPSDTVRPNLMYILDDSGSMSWDFMPDNIHNGPGAGASGPRRNCKSCSTSSACSTASVTCSNSPATANGKATWGEPPYFSAQFNQIYYNPDITYPPGVSSTGASLGNANPVAAMDDAYLNPGTTKDLTSTYPEIYYCNISTSPTVAQRADPAVCRRNGINNVAAAPNNYFLYWKNVTSGGPDGGYPNHGGGVAANSFRFRHEFFTGNPHYFRITPHEYCSDANLTDCRLANADGSAPTGFPIPAPLRYCKTSADAASTLAVSGSSGSPLTPRCKKKFDARSPTYFFPRYGRFFRTDIVPATASYPKSATAVRTDCAGATSCTYAEELQNFANWYSYYRTRMMAMKSATGRAFIPIDDRYRVGFITINPGSPVAASRYLALGAFDATQKGNWYSRLYGTGFSGGTPLRGALSRVGRHYAGVFTGINDGMTPDPMTHSCQQNFALLTTDGYYNDSSTAAVKPDGSQIENEDNVDQTAPPIYSSRATGTYDGNLSGASRSLADVAMYYYKNDLRPAAAWPAAIAENNVPGTAKDFATHQHMTTFTLGLGLQGLMDYIADYETNPAGDFARIKAGTTGACSWTTGTCDWPVPSASSPTSIDDLWHAAVNGRGIFYSASDPNSLADGLAGALSQLQVQTAAASASATSSPNITETDNFIYSSTFRTVKWDGEIVAQRLDATTGAVLPAIVWSAQALLNLRVAATSDTRTIWKFDSGAANKLRPFQWADLSSAPSGGIAAERPYFENKCTALSQCPLLTLAQQTQANNGQNMVEWLRGRTGLEGTVYRDREHVLGDPVNATPAFVKAPRFNFNDAVTPAYATFKTTNASRQGVLYVAANDGMLHAFNGDTGQEMWAYVPRIVFPNLHELATDNWAVRHKYSVDGSPQAMDVFDGAAGAWKTILVAGLNKGGRGFYALDVTDPANPKGMWEICSDSTLCEASDPDMGRSFGNPVIAKRASDGRWVVLVTSGVNNVSPGNGRGYLYVLDAFTGAILRKVEARDGATTVGDTTTPSGFSKISAFANSFLTDNTATFVYGGDLFGNLWRFDMSVDPPAATRIAELKDGSSPPKPQSITTRPELGVINGQRVIFVGTGRYLGEKDLQDPATLTPALQWAYQQSFYAIRDKGANWGNPRTVSGPEAFVRRTIIDGGTTRTTSTTPPDPLLNISATGNGGWYVDFNPGNTSPGERVNLDPQLVMGTLVVVTNVPNNNACTVGGDSWIYQFDYKTGQYVATSPGAVLGTKFTGQITVGIVVVRTSAGVFKGIRTGGGGGKDTFGIHIGGEGGGARRVSWRELVQ